MNPPGLESAPGASGFFARVLVALLMVNLTATGAVVTIAYYYSSEALDRHARAHLDQQAAALAEGFEEGRLRSLSRTLRALVDAPELDDYLLGSEAERLVLQRRIERRFKRVWTDFPAFSELRFIDDSGRIAAGMVRGRRVATRSSDARVEGLEAPARALYEKLSETPLLLFSGNMEWFLPPREMQLSAPVRTQDGSYIFYAAEAKLDKDTGLFGGAVIVRVELDPWFAELGQLRFFGVNPIWVLTPGGDALLSPADEAAQLDPRAYLTASGAEAIRLDGEGVIAHRELMQPNGESLMTLAISVPGKILSRELKPVLNFFTLVLLGSALVLTLVSYVISRYLSRPVMELAVARNQLANAHRIARLGHWEWDIAADNLVFSENVIGIHDLAVPLEGIPMGRFVESIHPGDREAFRTAINTAVGDETATSVEFRIRRSDGEEQHLQQEIDLVAGGHRRLVGTIQDVSERKRSEAQIRELAYFDTVTNLGNRRTLIESGRQALAASLEQGRRVGILFLDLDHFKRINDTLGHNAGDELLRQVALRLAECARTFDPEGHLPGRTESENLVARLGGDEFVVLLAHQEDQSEVVRVAEHLCASLTVPFSIEDREVTATGSVGISISPKHGDDIDILLRRADAAMYHAKSRGRNRFELYTSDIEEEVARRMSMEARLRRALEGSELVLHFQPRVEVESARIAGIEALIRWMDPEHGLIGPDQFIPFAEESGLIVPIGDWVILAACDQLAQWQRRWPGLHMSINISPAQFASRDLLERVSRILEETEVNPDHIELELTENALFTDVESGVHLAQALKDLGLALSIDDFGTGYSSLQLLRQFPVDSLKIDRSFIRDLLTDEDDAMIVMTSIGLAKNLGLRVVAEGVEQQGQFELLKTLGCDEVQGYLFGRPLPADQVTDLFSSIGVVGIDESLDAVIGG